VQGGDRAARFGLLRGTPISGDWNGDGYDEIGVRRGKWFFLDFNGNGVWDRMAGGDKAYRFGNERQKPVVGDWDGDGADEIGVRGGRTFYLDYNSNGRWDRVAGGDKAFRFGTARQKPVTGDWNGDGVDEIGVRAGRTFILDFNGNGRRDGIAGGDKAFRFGTARQKPVIGDWNGDGIDEIGVRGGATFYLDVNGNGRWDKVAGGDRSHRFGTAKQVPLSGYWRPAQYLLVAGDLANGDPGSAKLTANNVALVLQQAVDSWSARALSNSQEEALGQLDVGVGNLPNGVLAQTLGSTVTLNVNAAGRGWFIDASPWESGEFLAERSNELRAHPDRSASNRVDLLTVLIHELGHVLGYDHLEFGVMSDALPPGVRRLLDGECESEDADRAAKASPDFKGRDTGAIDGVFAYLGSEGSA
jgi:hypothetical protein